LLNAINREQNQVQYLPEISLLINNRVLG